MKTLDVGCGDRGQGDVNLDVVRTKDCNVIGDACFLPFRHNCFDNLIAQHVLEHLMKPNKGLHEIIRVLKPYGVATIIVPKPFFINNSFAKLMVFLLNLPLSLFPDRLKPLFKSLRRLKKGTRMRHKGVITRAYMEKQAKKIGFEILEFTEMEDILYCFFQGRKRQKLGKLFEFKPRIFGSYKIKCQKLKTSFNHSTGTT